MFSVLHGHLYSSCNYLAHHFYSLYWIKYRFVIIFRFHSYTPISCIKIYINVIVLSEAKWDLGNLKSPSYVKWMFKTFIQRITWLVDQAQSLPCCFCGSTMYKEAVRRQRTLLLVFISVHIFRYVINVVFIWLLLNFHTPIF